MAVRDPSVACLRLPVSARVSERPESESAHQKFDSSFFWPRSPRLVDARVDVDGWWWWWWWEREKKKGPELGFPSL